MIARLLTALAIVIALTIPANAETIRLGFIPVGDCLQLYVAEEMGYFAEEGITVEKTPLKGGALIAMGRGGRRTRRRLVQHGVPCHGRRPGIRLRHTGARRL